MTQLLWGIAGLVISVGGIMLYSGLVNDRERVKEAWRNVEGHLKRRQELLPRIAEIVRRFNDFETASTDYVDTLITRTKNARGPEPLCAAERNIGRAIKQMIGISDAYPDLQADTDFCDVQRLISLAEGDAQNAQQEYNRLVKKYNRNVDAFPNLLVSKTLGFGCAELFDLEY